MPRTRRQVNLHAGFVTLAASHAAVAARLTSPARRAPAPQPQNETGLAEEPTPFRVDQMVGAGGLEPPTSAV